MGFIKCQRSAHRSTAMICWWQRAMCDLIAAIDQNMNGVGRAFTGRWWCGLAPWRCAMALIGAARPEATKHGRRWEQGQIGEGTTADSPRRLSLAGKRWPRSVVMASLSKWKRMATVLLGDFPAPVKGGSVVVRHLGAPRLVGWAREAVG
jgi:hypothetical protein